MKEKQAMKTWKKVLLFILAQAMFTATLTMAFNVATGTRIMMRTTSGLHAYSMDLLGERVEFEESEVYDYLLEEAVNDIALLAVVRSQMETGGRYNGKKRIDITSYANRRNQETEDEVTAEFYLEDLLKWNRYGFVYDVQNVWIDNYEGGYSEVTAEDAENEIAEYKIVPHQSVSTSEAGDGNGYYVPSVWMQQSIDYNTPYANFQEVYTDEEGRTCGTLNVLKCRYKTVDGKMLEELVDNWQDYFTLVHNLDVTMANLAYNYELYQNLNEIYGEGKSNVKYCVYMVSKINGFGQYFSNLPEYNAMKTKLSTKEFREKFGNYLYYYPGEMKYETNTRLSEKVIFDIVTDRQLSYAYPESTKIWVGVDTEYPLYDAFASARESYYRNDVSVVWFLSLSVVFMAAYFVLMIVLFRKAGWRRQEDQTAVFSLRAFDKLHTEFTLLFTAGVGVLFAYLWVLLIEGGLQQLLYHGYQTSANLVFAAAVLMTASVFNGLLLSFVRRVKAHNLFSGMLIVRICCTVREKWEESVRQNEHAAKRNWSVYFGYLLVNFILLTAGWGIIWDAWHSMSTYSFMRVQTICGVVLILAALVFDAWTGYRTIMDKNERYRIIAGINRIRDGEVEHQITEVMHGENQVLAEAVNNIGEGIRKAVETSMKDERLKADLITNVSHDIKTPLTSIINYVDLLKREKIQDEKIQGYIDVLDVKSQRLKQLTEDLVEASKISSGNIAYVFERINLTELVHQAVGEFSEKFEQKGLMLVDNLAGQTAYIEADSRRMWRVIENLFHNIYKYAMENTRVYLMMKQELVGETQRVSLSIKNISAQPLNIDASELTERFIRGDVSRSTEGSGLGLSIAKNLTEAQHGAFEIYLDGDLFKVTITFPLMEDEIK